MLEEYKWESKSDDSNLTNPFFLIKLKEGINGSNVIQVVSIME